MDLYTAGLRHWSFKKITKHVPRFNQVSKVVFFPARHSGARAGSAESHFRGTCNDAARVCVRTAGTRVAVAMP